MSSAVLTWKAGDVPETALMQLTQEVALAVKNESGVSVTFVAEQRLVRSLSRSPDTLLTQLAVSWGCKLHQLEVTHGLKVTAADDGQLERVLGVIHGGAAAAALPAPTIE